MSFAPFYRKRGCVALSFLALLSSTAPVLANPENGVVAAGSADITTNGPTLNINQYSDRAVIDWRSFNISPSELTQFHQPSTGSITVNRVNDANPSKILGALKSNGNIVIINPNGVMFGRDSKVDVGGLIATTLDVSNDDVMAGGALKFKKANGITGSIINEGNITAREAGLVGLVADNVENSGVIQARLGRVVLASGDVTTIDFQGDGLLLLEVTDENAKRLIRHSGKIDAAGGDVLLTAAAGRNIVDSLVHVSGEIKTPTISQKNGRIVIGAAGMNRTTRTGKASKVIVSGTVAAQGQMAGETGGGIQILADEIDIKNTADILADGRAGGGTINIGGSFQGGMVDADYSLLNIRRPELEHLQSAQTVVVENGAEIDASATENGNGGDIILWADRAMYFYGTNRSRGGANSGNGGLVETSGKLYLDYNGLTDTRALNGDVGMLLLDPTNITISNAASQNSGSPITYSPTGDDVTSILNASTLASQMNYSNVIVQTRASGSQLGDINVNANVISDDYENGYTLYLIADHDINVNALMNYSSYGSMDFSAGNDINVNSDISASEGLYLRAQNNVVLNANAGSYGGLHLIVGNDIIVNTDISSNLTYIDTLVADRSVSLGNNMGSINLDSSELAHFTSKYFFVGQNSNVGDITIEGASPWRSLNLKSSSAGSITTIGNQTLSNGFNFQTDDLHFGGTLTGATNVTISTVTNGTSIGLGDGTGGTVHLSLAELAMFAGADDYTFGAGGVEAAITVAAQNWSGDLNLYTSNANVSIIGNQTVAASKNIDIRTGVGGSININGSLATGNNLTLEADTIQMGADVSGPGMITISSSNALIGTGIGTGAAGVLQLDDTELNHIKDGWTDININSQNTVTMNAHTWADRLNVFANDIAVDGAQNMGSNDLNLYVASGDINLNSTLSGSGILTIETSTSGTSTIAGSSGTFNLSVAELNNIQNGWDQIVLGNSFGSNAGLNVGAYTWNDAVKFRNSLGILTFSGIQNFGTNNVEISTSRLLDLNANLIGSGQLTLNSGSNGVITTIGNTANSSAFRVSATDITSYLLGKGWSSFVIGSSNHTAAITVTGANNWNADLALKTKGIITVAASSAQDVGAHNLTIETDSNPAINSALSGTGIFTVSPISYTNSTKNIGLAGTSGAINLTTAELARITNGWSKQIYGRVDQAGDINIGTNTWSDPTYFLTNGIINIQGNQTSSDASADSTKLVFVSGSAFYNSSGYSIDPGTGRYLLYSTSPDYDGYNGLVRTTKRYNKTYDTYSPSSVTETGNVFLYSEAPILDITIDDATREYGLANSTFTYAVTNGLIDGDVVTDAITTANLSSTATANTNVGSASIIGSFLSAMGYQFNITNGNLGITKATLTATADNQSREYGLSNPALTVAYTGFRNGETASVLDTAAAATTGATILSNVGSYGITASGGIDNNYDFTYAGGNLAITKATLTITADNQTREYGSSNPALTVSYSGFRNGENASVLDTTATVATSATILSNVGSYAITASGATDNNYDVLHNDGNFVISPKSIFVNIPSQSIRSTGTPSPYIVTYSGFVNGDTDSLITQTASVGDTAGNYATPGNYQIIPYGAQIGSSNYSLVYVPSNLTLTSTIPDSVTRMMSLPASFLGETGAWQDISGEKDFTPLAFGYDGSYFIDHYLPYVILPADYKYEDGKLLSPVSGLSLHVEYDLAVLFALK